MPLLSYSAITNYPFQPFTKIYSSDINAMYAAVQAWANGNIDFNNVTALGLKRYGAAGNLQAGTANYVVYNDASGYLAEAAQLPTAQGGVGFNATPVGVADAGKVISVNAAGSGLQLSSAPTPDALKVYNFYRFG